MLKKILFLSLIVLLISGCSAQSPNAVKVIITQNDVLTTFKNYSIPMENVVTYTEETDVNKLLGRPGQYVEKINWNDSRVKNADGTIEIFKTKEELENRKAYIEKCHKDFPNLRQYIFVHKNALLRLDYAFTPQQAEEYKHVLEKI